MPIKRVTSLSEPGLDVFGSLTERQLKACSPETGGLFIAESPKVIKVALDAGYEPVSLLCEEKHIEGDAKDIVLRCGDIPVYVGERELLAQLTGYVLTRGVLCAMRRKPQAALSAVCRDAHRVVVINGVVDSTNIGAIFRSAAALGIDAVVVTSTSCDPLNRRSVRVSMGSVFLVPWTWSDNYQQELNALGFKTVAYRAYRPVGRHRRRTVEGGRQARHHYGHGRRRTAPASHRRSRLGGTHPHVASGGFAQCGGGISCGILGIEKAMTLN